MLRHMVQLISLRTKQTKQRSGGVDLVMGIINLLNTQLTTPYIVALDSAF